MLLQSVASVLLLIFTANAQGGCRVRKEIHDLSDGEWDRLINAFHQIKQQPRSRFGRESAGDDLQSNCTSKLAATGIIEIFALSSKLFLLSCPYKRQQASKLCISCNAV